MTILMIVTGILAVSLAVILVAERRCYIKAKGTLMNARKTFEVAQNALAEANKKVQSDTSSNDEGRWYRHYAFFPLGQIPLADFSEEDKMKIRSELSGVLGRRIRKYFEPKETLMNGRRVVMIDLLIKENTNGEKEE